MYIKEYINNKICPVCLNSKFGFSIQVVGKKYNYMSESINDEIILDNRKDKIKINLSNNEAFFNFKDQLYQDLLIELKCKVCPEVNDYLYWSTSNYLSFDEQIGKYSPVVEDREILGFYLEKEHYIMINLPRQNQTIVSIYDPAFKKEIIFPILNFKSLNFKNKQSIIQKINNLSSLL